MISPSTPADLMADPGELSVRCLDCHHTTTMPVAALLPRSAAETPFSEVWGGHRTAVSASLSAASVRWQGPARCAEPASG